LVNRFNIEQVYSQGNSKYYKVELKGTNQGISVTVDSAKATLQKIEQLFKDVNNGTFNSLDEFKQTCGDLFSKLNISQVYSNGDYVYYRVSLKDGFHPMETNIKVAKEQKVSGKTASTANDKIDINALFGDKESINAKDMVELFESWETSNNPTQKKLYDLLNSAIDRLGITNKYDEQFMFDAFIKLLNDEVGVENTNPLTLTKESIEKLNENDPFETIKNILQTSESGDSEFTPFENEYFFGSIDGVSNFFVQGGIGDCWLIAGLNALNNSEIGQDIIKNAIVKDEINQTVTITFGIKDIEGNNFIKTFSYTEIEAAKKLGIYSRADADGLVIEMGMEQLFLAVSEGKFIDPLNILLPKGYSTNIPGKIIESNNVSQLIYAMTGIIPIIKHPKTTNIENYHYSYLESLYDNFKNGEVTLSCTFNSNYTGYVSDVWITNQHAYTITNISITNPSNPKTNTITIVNPHNPDVSLEISWEEFESMIQDLEECFLKKPTINDMQNRINCFISCATNGDYSNDYLNEALYLFKSLDEIGNFKYTSNIEIIYPNGEFDVRYEYIIEFNFNNQHYNVSLLSYDSNKSIKTTTPSELTKYTNNNSLINKYFEVAASVDGEPLIYRLKDGVTYEDFLTEVQAEKQQIANSIKPIKDVYQNSNGKYSDMLKDLSGYHRTLAYSDSSGDHYYDRGFYFTMNQITKDEDGNYICSADSQMSGPQTLDVFNGLFETIKTLINDTDKNLLNQIGEDRLKEALYFMWNDLASGKQVELWQVLDNVVNKIYYSMYEYLQKIKD